MADNKNNSVVSTALDVLSSLTPMGFLGKCTEAIAELVIEKAVEKAKEQWDKHQFKKRVEAELTHYYSGLSEKEHFDPKELNRVFIENNHIVKACFTATDSAQRQRAKRLLYQTVASSPLIDAKTAEAKAAVRQYISIVLRLTEEVLAEKVSDENWFLCGKTADEISEKMATLYQRLSKQIEYENSFQQFIDGQNSMAASYENPFFYRNDILTFRGRKTEQENLKCFLDEPDPVLWTAITGPGGAGKSKLMYHVTKQMEKNPNWKVLWIDKDLLSDIVSYKRWKTEENLLFVVDYVGIVAEELGKWLKDIQRTQDRPNMVRFVLLEREGNGGSEPMWFTQLKKADARSVAAIGWKVNGSPLWSIGALEENDLTDIATDYARHQGETLSDQQKTEILKKLKELDANTGIFRPLILIFLTDALLENQDFRRWNVDQLLTELVKRYRDHWKDMLCRGDEGLFYAAEFLMVLATAGDGLQMSQKPDCLSNADWNKVQALKKTNTYGAFLEGLNGREEGNRLIPLQPDLLGEAFVLEWLHERMVNYDESVIRSLSEELWTKPQTFVVFLDHCIHDFAESEQFAMDIFKELLLLEPSKEEYSIALFSGLLVNFTAYIHNVEEKVSAVNIIGSYYKRNKNNPDIAKVYAGVYAKGLSNLTNANRDITENEETLTELCTVYEQHKKNLDVAYSYTRGLVNLVYNYADVTDKQKMIDTLCTVYEQHNDILDIAKGYALCLSYYILICDEISEKANKIKKLSEVYQKFWEVPDIAEVYAKGLSNLANNYSDIKDKQEMIDTLCTVYKQHKDKANVATMYASSLYLLFAEQYFNNPTEEKVQEFVNSVSVFCFKVIFQDPLTPHDWMEGLCRIIALVRFSHDNKVKGYLAQFLQLPNCPSVEKQAILNLLSMLKMR